MRGDNSRAHVFGEWLVRQPGVVELFATDAELAGALERWDKSFPRRKIDPNRTDYPRDAEMEAKIAADPDDTDLVAVYGDWLLAQGNPLGEVIALRQAPRERQRVLSSYANYFWGKLVEYRRLFKIDWGDGGVERVTITRTTRIQVEWSILVSWLLDLPITAFMRELSIGPLPSSVGDFEEILRAILARRQPALHRLRVTAEHDRWRTSFGEIESFESLPALRELALTGRRANVASFDHPTLESLVLDLDAATASLISTLGSARCPMLQHIDLRLGLFEPARWEMFYQASGFPKLKTLRLALAQGVDAQVIGALADAAWLAGLRELDLSAMALDREALTALKREKQRFAHVGLVLDAHSTQMLSEWDNVAPR